jgi:hypothetical protein
MRENYLLIAECKESKSDHTADKTGAITCKHEPKHFFNGTIAIIGQPGSQQPDIRQLEKIQCLEGI